MSSAQSCHFMVYLQVMLSLSLRTFSNQLVRAHRIKGSYKCRINVTARGEQGACSLPCVDQVLHQARCLDFKLVSVMDHQTPRFTDRQFFTSLHCPCSGCAFHSYSTTYPEGGGGGRGNAGDGEVGWGENS